MSATADLAFEAVRRLARSIPAGARGKARMSRWLARPFFGRGRVTIPDRFGNRLACPSLEEPIAVALFADGVYEPDTIRRIVSSLPRGGAFLDVGANVGSVALAVAALRPDVTVICVEGEPGLAELLRHNVEVNRRANLTVVQALAGSDERTVPFYRAPDAKFGMGSVGPQFGPPSLMLAQRRLDDVLDDVGCVRVDVVKIDVEGAEAAALRGLERRLAQHPRPVVVFEFADWAEARIPGQQPGDAQRFLVSLGYRLSRLGSACVPERPLEAPLTAGACMLVAEAL